MAKGAGGSNANLRVRNPGEMTASQLNNLRGGAVQIIGDPDNGLSSTARRTIAEGITAEINNGSLGNRREVNARARDLVDAARGYSTTTARTLGKAKKKGGKRVRVRR